MSVNESVGLGQRPVSEVRDEDDELMRVFADDWKVVWQRKVELYFFIVVITLLIASVASLDICPSPHSPFLQAYVCDGTHRFRLFWGIYVSFAVLSVIALLARDYRYRKSSALVIRHLLTGEDFYKVLFDGLKNSVLAIALGTTVVHVLKGMTSGNWKTDRAWFSDFVSPSLPTSWFLVGVAISWLVAACLLFAANTGMRCSYYRLSGAIAKNRKLSEASRDIFRHSLLQTFCVVVFYAEFFCFLGVTAYQIRM